MKVLFARFSLPMIGLALVAAAPPPVSNYNPLETFAPFHMDPPVTRYRSSDGTPGPEFWQNRADYTIDATLDPATHSITGTTQIRYTNNSPDTLDVL